MHAKMTRDAADSKKIGPFRYFERRTSAIGRIPSNPGLCRLSYYERLYEMMEKFMHMVEKLSAQEKLR